CSIFYILSFSLIITRPHRSPPFPYTTLFRSVHRLARRQLSGLDVGDADARRQLALDPDGGEAHQPDVVQTERSAQVRERGDAGRSEEHTSELQSPDHLVCRLLLEKKNRTLTR